MSDNPAGPDWWLASDGRWYPPTSPPGASRPAPPTTTAPQPGPDWWLASDGNWYPPSSAPGSGHGGSKPAWVGPALAGWIQALFWIAAVLSAITIVAAVRALSAFETYVDSPASFSRWERWADADEALGTVFATTWLVGVPLLVLMIIWTFKVSQTVDRFAPLHRSWSSGWAVGCWFVPVGNFVLCKLVLNELERLAFAPRSGGLVTPEWRRQRTRPLGWVWWLTYLGGVAAFVISSSFVDTDGLRVATDSDIRAHYGFAIASLVCFVAAGVAGALYVREVSRPLSPRALGDAWH